MALLLSPTLAGKPGASHENEQGGNSRHVRRKCDKFLLQVIVSAGNTSFPDGNADNGIIHYGDPFAMQNTPSVLVLFAALAALAAAPGHAAESKAGRQANAAVGKRPDMRESMKPHAGKARRSERETPRHIVTYNLFQDPVFKLNGALADKRQLGTPPHAERHAQLGNALKPARGPADTGALRLQEPEMTGIDFGCSDKPFRTTAKTREVTACYKHNVDRSWKTQTYLSREVSTEGSQKWGGGLALRYAY